MKMIYFDKEAKILLKTGGETSKSYLKCKFDDITDVYGHLKYNPNGILDLSNHSNQCLIDISNQKDTNLNPLTLEELGLGIQTDLFNLYQSIKKLMTQNGIINPLNDNLPFFTQNLM